MKDRYDRSTAILEIIRNRDLRSVLQFALNDSFQIKNQETFIALFGFYLDNTFPEYPLPRPPLSPDFAKKLESLLIREKKWISVEPISYDQHFAFSSVSMGNYVASGNQAAVSFLRKFDISPATNDYFVLPKYLFGLKGKITPKALKKIKLIVKAGAELNTHYKNAYPIAFATEHRNIELMQFFLESGSFANIWPSNPEICPPLAIAVENADIKAIKLLKKFKADTEANYNRALGTCISSKQKRNQNKKAEMVKISEMTMSPQVRAAFEGP
ncbi:MAG: hypothetical protein IPK04_17345 [Bdellovibrionales bacterium]|nr:hypothetical protein [Bdellovibrionales bacterium]